MPSEMVESMSYEHYSKSSSSCYFTLSKKVGKAFVVVISPCQRK